MAFEIGQRVGDYEVVSVLGAGGMGRVYRVRNVISDRTEAMKVLLPNLVAEPDLASRFSSEIRMLASFDHPNIAQLHTALQLDNQLVMMMEFVEGDTLEQRAKQGPIPQSDIIHYMQQVLSALSYAHGRGVVHRDIKLANIMLTPLGVVKLMDFGIAKAQTESDLTRPGTTMGSLYYMSPEQVRGGTVDARSDIYSVGVVMYELLAGRRPFEANSAYDILNQQCNVAPRPPLEINPQLPAALNEIILCALQKDPANRFQNAQAIQNALRQVAAAPAGDRTTEGAPFTPIVIPEAPQPANFPVAAMAPPPPSSSHRGAWIALGALAVLVVVGAAAAGLPRLLHTSAKTESESPAPPVSAAAVASPPAVAPPPAAASTTADQAATGNAPNTPAKSADAPATATMKAPVAKKDQLATPPRAAYKAEGATPGAFAAKQPENAGPTADDMQQAQEQKIHLDARASTVSASVESLKSQQEAAGLGLRHDMAGAYARMTSYLGLANDALQSGNLAAARGYMDKADKEISTLESFFGK